MTRLYQAALLADFVETIETTADRNFGEQQHN